MKDKKIYKVAIIALSLIVLTIVAAFFLSQRSINLKKEFEVQNMKIQSPAFKNNLPIPKKYTCDGENINPHLQIEETPEDAKSLVLIVDDPDAPGGNYTHWVVWNINPDISQIEEGEVPEGAIEGLNDSGNNSYVGPCPPSGIHRYYFKVYALDRNLEENSSLRKEDIESLMEGKIIESAELVGTYERE